MSFTDKKCIMKDIGQKYRKLTICLHVPYVFLTKYSISASEL